MKKIYLFAIVYTFEAVKNSEHILEYVKKNLKFKQNKTKKSYGRFQLGEARRLHRHGSVHTHARQQRRVAHHRSGLFQVSPNGMRGAHMRSVASDC